jgi:hypothetical protein
MPFPLSVCLSVPSGEWFLYVYTVCMAPLVLVCFYHVWYVWYLW